MKFHADSFDVPSISGYGPGWVAVSGEKIHHSLVLGARGQRLNWDCSNWDDLSTAHFDLLAGLNAELVIFGSGSRLRFPRPQWLQGLIARRIGLETMDTQAACRTYNILAGEGRNVVTALLIEPPA